MSSGPPPPRRWRARLLTLLRLLLLVLPVVWLSKHLDTHAILASVQQVGVTRLALALPLQLLVVAVVSVRWRILLFSYGGVSVPSTWALIRANLVANYIALLPVPAADEGVRVLRTLHAFPAARLSPYLVLVTERLCGLTGLLLLAVLASLISGDALATEAQHALALGSLVTFVLALPALALPTLLVRWPALRQTIARVPRVGSTLAQLAPPARARHLLWCVLLSVLGHFGSCAVIALLFAPIDPAASLLVCTRVQPVVLLAMSIVVTPGGLGQRELAFATLYGLVGVAPEHAVTVSLLSFALALAQSGVGGLVYAFERVRGPTLHTDTSTLPHDDTVGPSP